MIKVMLVDDHEMVRMGLRTALDIEDDVEVVAEAESGEEALKVIETTEVDVILMDVMMAGMGGIATCRQVKELGSSVKVLMLTSSSDEQAVMSALVAGADGYLLKNVRREELLRCLRATHAGKRTLDPSIAKNVVEQLRELSQGRRSGPHLMSPGGEPDADLSEREMEVVGLIAEGKTNKEIAKDLIIAEKTARNHVSRILNKLGLSRRSQAAAWAARTQGSGP